METYYVTTPIYYANSLPHLGHLYTTLVADCVARYKQQRGFATYFLTGTDEHGINIERAAARAGRTPKEHVDYIVGELKRMLADFGLDEAHGGYDIFMRTTEPFHYEGVSELWRRIARTETPKGRACIYKGNYEGWFCAACATFKTEDEYAAPESEGEPPRCLVHETPLDRVAEESYFFRLSDYDEALLALYESRPDFIRPETRRNEVVSFVRGGLQDLSISRQRSAVSWAIPVPDDPGHTIYIWLDALTNYITALGYGNDERARVLGAGAFEKYWPGTHLIGKDILRQHAIYWPAFLLAAGIETPQSVIAHGLWLDRDGRKMSKTLGNTVDLKELLALAGRRDALRYFCLREMIFGQDGKVWDEAIVARINSDLAGGLGNLTSRTLKMISLYCDGLIPDANIPEDMYLTAKRAGVDPDAMALVTTLERARDQFITYFEDFAFSRALEAAWSIIARADKMISDAKPWELAKNEEQRQVLDAVLYRAAESLRWLAVLLYPVMPETMRKIYEQLGLSGDVSKVDPASLAWGGLKTGTRTGEAVTHFPRIDYRRDAATKNTGGANASNKNRVQKGSAMADTKPDANEDGTHATQADAVPGAQAAADTRPDPPMQGATEADAVPKTQAAATTGVVNLIGIEDFAKVEMRAGEILTAERVPKADKLLRFTVDVGEAAPRQILAGIAQHYEPDDLVGRKIVVVTNLQPRKLRGFESQGMVLAASVGDEGRPVLATFAEDVPNGAKLK